LIIRIVLVQKLPKYNLLVAHSTNTDHALADCGK